jgi:hypothetical protein
LIWASLKRLDNIFLLGKSELINIEFDSTGKPENLNRYLFYGSIACASLYDKIKVYPNMTTIVVYPGSVKTIPTPVYSDKGSLLFKVEQISLAKLIDGDKIFAELEKTVKSSKLLNFSEKELLNIALAPLGKIKGSRRQFNIKFANLGIRLVKKGLVDDTIAALMWLAAGTKALKNKTFLEFLEKVKQMTGKDFLPIMDNLTDGMITDLVNQTEARVKKENEAILKKERAKRKEEQAKRKKAEKLAEQTLAENKALEAQLRKYEVASTVRIKEKRARIEPKGKNQRTAGKQTKTVTKRKKLKG